METVVVIIIRELVKAGLVGFYWLIPLWLQHTYKDSGYLWFFILSFVLTCATLSHYENLEEVEYAQEEPDKEVTADDLYPKK